MHAPLHLLLPRLQLLAGQETVIASDVPRPQCTAPPSGRTSDKFAPGALHLMRAWPTKVSPPLWGAYGTRGTPVLFRPLHTYLDLIHFLLFLR